MPVVGNIIINISSDTTALIRGSEEGQRAIEGLSSKALGMGAATGSAGIGLVGMSIKLASLGVSATSLAAKLGVLKPAIEITKTKFAQAGHVMASQLSRVSSAADVLQAKMSSSMPLVAAKVGILGKAAEGLGVKMAAMGTSVATAVIPVKSFNSALGYTAPALALLSNGIAAVGVKLFPWVAGLSVATVGLAAIATPLATFVGLITLVGGAVIATQAIGSLNEQLKLSRETLGSASMEVEAFAVKVSSKFGRAETDTLLLASALGEIGSEKAGLEGEALAKFTIDLSKLTLDVAAFAKIGSKNAFDGIKAALGGKSFGLLEKYGTTLSDNTTYAYAYAHGIAAVGEELTKGQTTMARTGQILEGLAIAKNALRDNASSTANLSESISGRWETLAATIGQALVPATDLAYLAFNGILQVTDKILAGIQSVANVAVKVSNAFQSLYKTPEVVKQPPKIKENPKVDAEEIVARGKDVKELKTRLEEQTAMFGLAGHAADVARLKSKGATDEQLKDVSAMAAKLDAMEEQKKKSEELGKSLKSLFDDNQTPAQKFQTEIQKLDTLLRTGTVNAEVYAEAKRKIDKAYDDTSGLTSFFENNKTAAQKLNDEMVKLDAVFSTGRVGLDQYADAQKKLMKEFEDGSGTTKAIDDITSKALDIMKGGKSGNSGVLIGGSQEARSAILANQNQGKINDKQSMIEAIGIAKQSLLEQKELNKSMRTLVKEDPNATRGLVGEI